jgi:hypothetical protein
LENEYNNHKFIYDYSGDCNKKLCKPIFFDKDWCNAMICIEYRNVTDSYMQSLFSTINYWQKQLLNNEKRKANFFGIKKFLQNQHRKKVETRIESDLNSWLIQTTNWLIKFVSKMSNNKTYINLSDFSDQALEYYSSQSNSFQSNNSQLYINSILSFKNDQQERMISHCPVHGDYNHFNIFWENNSIVILDWQDSCLISNPFQDIMYLLLNLLIAFSDQSLSDLNIQELCNNNHYVSSLVDQTCGLYAKKLSFDLKFLFTMIALAAINMRFNDHRKTEHARLTCPLYNDNILVSFCNLFIEKGAS